MKASKIHKSHENYAEERNTRSTKTNKKIQLLLGKLFFIFFFLKKNMQSNIKKEKENKILSIVPTIVFEIISLSNLNL